MGCWRRSRGCGLRERCPLNPSRARLPAKISTARRTRERGPREKASIGAQGRVRRPDSPGGSLSPGAGGVGLSEIESACASDHAHSDRPVLGDGLSTAPEGDTGPVHSRDRNSRRVRACPRNGSGTACHLAKAVGEREQHAGRLRNRRDLARRARRPSPGSERVRSQGRDRSAPSGTDRPTTRSAIGSCPCQPIWAKACCITESIYCENTAFERRRGRGKNWS
jgi:hypothetical protein